VTVCTVARDTDLCCFVQERVGFGESIMVGKVNSLQVAGMRLCFIIESKRKSVSYSSWKVRAASRAAVAGFSFSSLETRRRLEEERRLRTDPSKNLSADASTFSPGGVSERRSSQGMERFNPLIIMLFVSKLASSWTGLLFRRNVLAHQKRWR